jgi:hypothetical protein
MHFPSDGPDLSKLLLHGSGLLAHESRLSRASWGQNTRET